MVNGLHQAVVDPDGSKSTQGHRGEAKEDGEDSRWVRPCFSDADERTAILETFRSSRSIGSSSLGGRV